MKRSLALPLVALAFVAAGCPSSPADEAAAERARAGGTLALSADDAELYVVDADNDALVIVDAVTGKVRHRVTVGDSPARVLVNADGKVLVSNRLGRSVSIVDPRAGKELAKVRVGAEPVGLALAADGRLLVANHTQHTVSVVDLKAMKELKQIPSAADPTGVTVVPGGKAYVTHARSGQVSVLDLEREQFTARPMSLQLAPERTAGEERLPNNPVDPVFNPEDGRVYVPHQQTKLSPVETTIDNPNAYAGGGPVSITVVANALATLDPSVDAVLDAPGIDLPFRGCFQCGVALPGAGDVPAVVQPATGPLSGPSAIAIEPSGQWMYVTNMNSNNVSILPTRPREFAFEPVKVGAGPNGIAITRTGERAFVSNAFDHTVSVLEAGAGANIVETKRFVVGESLLTPQRELGRRLFFAADDERMTNAQAGGVACASCHPGGRDDGRTWMLSEGPRNTPLLAGRNLRDSAPYHWDGLLEDMHAFKMVVETRMGGTGTQGGARGALATADFEAIMAYLDAEPGPDNPWRGEALTESQARGQALFESEAVECAKCHAGDTLQDNDFHDVGTAQPNDLFPKNGVNTPTLRNIFASAPYLHTGEDRTLEDRLRRNPGDKHGKTSHLSDAEVEDLVAYLKTL